MTYGAYEAREGEIFVCTEHCARNMAFQDLTPEFGKYTKLMDLMGMVCACVYSIGGVFVYML